METTKIIYEDIKKANETIKTMTISRTDKKTGKEISKEYAEVNQRVKAFRMVYPTGFIRTEMISNENGICIFKAIVGVYAEDGMPMALGIGTAYEKESSSFINQTSYIENCETSAVGRALGMAGFGIDTSIASAEEVQNAMANQKENKPVKKVIKATKDQISTIENSCSDEQLKKVIDGFKVKTLSDLTIEQASAVIKKLPKEKIETDMDGISEVEDAGDR